MITKPRASAGASRGPEHLQGVHCPEWSAGMSLRVTTWILLVATSALGCNRASPHAQEPVSEVGAAAKQVEPAAQASAAASSPQPDDPRVRCPPDARQYRVESAGVIECRDGRGRPHGPHLSWFANGQKMEEAYYVHGRYEGVRRWWRESGQLEAEESYRNGVLDGVGRDYHENGAVANESRWMCGEQVGVTRWWDESGRLVNQEHHRTSVPGCTKASSTANEEP